MTLKKVIADLKREDATSGVQLCQQLGVLEADGQTPVTDPDQLTSPEVLSGLQRFIAGK